MKTHHPALQSVPAGLSRVASKPYLPVSFDDSFDDSVIDVESVVSGAALFSMLGFICLLFIGCFDAGLIA